MMSEIIQFTVKKIYAPNGKGPAGVMVDHQYGKVQVWPDDLGHFQEGSQYEVTVSHQTYNNKDQYTVVGKSGIKNLGGSTAQQPNSNPRQEECGWGYEEGIFITGVVGRSMGSGQFSVMDIDNLVSMAKEAFRKNQ